jgi:hypothetical protein
MARRPPKPEPFSVAELEEIAQSPALQGFDKVLEYRPVLVPALGPAVASVPPSTDAVSTVSTVEAGLPSTVAASPTSTVDADLSSPVEALLQPTVVDAYSALWIAEGAEGVFTAARVKRIGVPEDALTRVEQAVYETLWDAGTPTREPYRFAQIGYSELAKRSGVTKRSIQSVIDRLLEKRFIAIETAADITTRRPTTYRVPDRGTMLSLMHDTGRAHVVRTGRGVFYARRLSTTVVAATASTVVDRVAAPVE